MFFAPRLRINKRILALCMGNHELYMRRRKPDTIEVQQMKQQAQEERHARQMQRSTKAKMEEELELQKKKNAEMEARVKEFERLQKQAEDGVFIVVIFKAWVYHYALIHRAYYARGAAKAPGRSGTPQGG